MKEVSRGNNRSAQGRPACVVAVRRDISFYKSSDFLYNEI